MWTKLTLQWISEVPGSTVVENTSVIHHIACRDELRDIYHIVIHTFQASHVRFASSAICRTRNTGQMVSFCKELRAVEGTLLGRIGSRIDWNSSRESIGTFFTGLSLMKVHLVVRSCIITGGILIHIFIHILTQRILPCTNIVSILISSIIRKLMHCLVILILRTQIKTNSLMQDVTIITSSTNTMSAWDTVGRTFLICSVDPFIVILMSWGTFEVEKSVIALTSEAESWINASGTSLGTLFTQVLSCCSWRTSQNCYRGIVTTFTYSRTSTFTLVSEISSYTTQTVISRTFFASIIALYANSTW